VSGNFTRLGHAIFFLTSLFFPLTTDIAPLTSHLLPLTSYLSPAFTAYRQKTSSVSVVRARRTAPASEDGPGPTV
jgi:hypothetical protein